MWWNTPKTIPFDEFMAGSTKLSLASGIYAPTGFEAGLDMGLMFFGGLAVVSLGLIAGEKLGIPIDWSKLSFTLSVLFWIGLLVFLGLKNPLLPFIR